MKILLTTLALLSWATLTAQTEKSATPIPIPTQNSKPETQHSTYAVVVGISDYQDAAIPDLRFADRDAEAFANWLRSPAGGGLDNDHLMVMTNQNATAGRIAEALDGLIEQAKEGDEVIIYFSGHGDVEGKKISQPGFLLCWDAPSRVYMGGGTYSLSFLQEVVATLSVQNKAKVVVITDACHAGKLAGNQIGGSQLTSANLARQYANEVKILSCQPNEFSLEGEQWGGGRGCFSYHLLDGLFGLADRNGDGTITVGEIDRYLEDKVTTEAAPQSQVPMLLGNKTERLATVNAAILADLKKKKSEGMPVFASIEGRGFEDDVLGKLDSSIVKRYFAFKKAVAEKRFFADAPKVGEAQNLADLEPAAEELYESLSAEPGLAPLHGFMKRNYAAALQDDAQQAMNLWLAADVQQLHCVGKSLKIGPIPRQLQRAAELLGEGHYMYRSLNARQLLFKGILKTKLHSSDDALSQECLSLFRRSLELEAQSPLSWHWMSIMYAYNLRQPDSAFVCAREAQKLAPNWVLPFADLGYALTQQNKLELAKQALEEAQSIDSLHPYVINRWAYWLTVAGGKANQEKAVVLFENYKESGGPLYPCWFSDYASILRILGRYSESELEYKAAISIDSTNVALWNNLGNFYITTRRYADAEPILKKTLELDPTHAVAWDNLAALYAQTHRYAEAEVSYKKATTLNTKYANAWGGLGSLYITTQRYTEAEQAYQKAIALNSKRAVFWNGLGNTYIQTQRYAEADSVLKNAIQLDSTYFQPCFNLGLVYFKTNRPEEARQNFLKALELNPNYVEAMLGLAYILFAKGKTAEAIGYVEQAIGKGAAFEQLESDEDLAPLRALPEWKALMKKHFPDKAKD